MPLESDEERDSVICKKKLVRSPIFLRSRRQQLEETTVLGSKRAHTMQGQAYAALEMLEAARYAQRNKGPDPFLARAGPMGVHTNIPPGVHRLPYVSTVVPEEVGMSGSGIRRKLLHTITKTVDSK